MKRAPRISLVVAGCAIVAVVMVTSPREKEPVYQGRRLIEWLDRIYIGSIFGSEPTESTEAKNAVAYFETNAVPFLLNWLRYESPPWRDTIKEAVRYLPSFISDSSLVEKAISDSREELANRATIGLSMLGSRGSSAVPELVKMLDDSEHWVTKNRALQLLRDLGPDGMAALIRRLDMPDRYARLDAIRAIGQGNVERDATAAVPFLVRSLESADEKEAVCAVESLGFLRIAPEIVVPALVRCLKMPNAPVIIAPGFEVNRQKTAASMLGNFGSQATSAVPALLTLARVSQGYTYQAVTNALHEIAPVVLAEPQ